MMDADKLRESLREARVILAEIVGQEAKARALFDCVSRALTDEDYRRAEMLEQKWAEHRAELARHLNYLVQAHRCPCLAMPMQSPDPGDLLRCDKVVAHDGEHEWSKDEHYDWEPKL